MSKIIKSLEQAVKLSLKARDTKDYDAKFDVKIGNNTWSVYEVYIASRDILCLCDQGTATFLVDTYGNDKSFAVLHDWNRDSEE